MTKGQTAKLKLPEDTEIIHPDAERGEMAVPEAVPQVRESEGAAEWNQMSSVPKDGNPIWLRDKDGNAVNAYWRTTRQFRKGSWQLIHYWAIWGQNPQKISLNPVEWMREQ